MGQCQSTPAVSGADVVASVCRDRSLKSLKDSITVGTELEISHQSHERSLAVLDRSERQQQQQHLKRRLTIDPVTEDEETTTEEDDSELTAPLSEGKREQESEPEPEQEQQESTRDTSGEEAVTAQEQKSDAKKNEPQETPVIDEDATEAEEEEDRTFMPSELRLYKEQKERGGNMGHQLDPFWYKKYGSNASSTGSSVQDPNDSMSSCQMDDWNSEICSDTEEGEVSMSTMGVSLSTLGHNDANDSLSNLSATIPTQSSLLKSHTSCTTHGGCCTNRCTGRRCSVAHDGMSSWSDLNTSLTPACYSVRRRQSNASMISCASSISKATTTRPNRRTSVTSWGGLDTSINSAQNHLYGGRRGSMSSTDTRSRSRSRSPVRSKSPVTSRPNRRRYSLTPSFDTVSEDSWNENSQHTTVSSNRHPWNDSTSSHLNANNKSLLLGSSLGAMDMSETETDDF